MTHRDRNSERASGANSSTNSARCGPKKRCGDRPYRADGRHGNAFQHLGAVEEHLDRVIAMDAYTGVFTYPVRIRGGPEGYLHFRGEPQPENPASPGLDSGRRSPLSSDEVTVLYFSSSSRFRKDRRMPIGLDPMAKNSISSDRFLSCSNFFLSRVA